MFKNVTSLVTRLYHCKTLYKIISECNYTRLGLINNHRCFSIGHNHKNQINDTSFAANNENFGSSDVDIESIAEGDPEIEKLLKVLILEVDLWRQDGQLIPDKIATNDWRELLMHKGRSHRLRYLVFLFKNERKKENRIRKIQERKIEREQIHKEAEESGHIKYGFGGCTIFLRIYDTTMDFYLNKNLMNAAQFSQHIVLDCSYDRHMTHMESKYCARQMCMLFAENRNHPQPFHIQFCNVDPESPSIKSLHRYMPPMYDKYFPFFQSPKSYLDLYPKEKLVYLTPHCKNDLVEWNHDDVYIIGAMVDKTSPKPLSLAKAKEEGLRMAKLPLERHLLWGSGAGKSFTLNQMTSILLDKRHTNSWDEAFKHIPRRKLVSQDELYKEKKEYPKMTSYTKKVYKPRQNKDVQVSGDILKKIQHKKIDFSKLYD